MQELIDVIRTAIAADANIEQKAAGVLACRTIASALDTEPGKPLTLGNAAPVQATSRISIDQVLDLVIARLSLVAKEHEQPRALPGAAAPPSAVTPPAAPGSLRIPLAPSSALKVAPRSANARTVPSKTTTRHANTARPTHVSHPSAARKP